MAFLQKNAVYVSLTKSCDVYSWCKKNLFSIFTFPISILRSWQSLNLCCYQLMKLGLEKRAAPNWSAVHIWGAEGICGQQDSHRQSTRISMQSKTLNMVIEYISPKDSLDITCVGTKGACYWGVKASQNWVGSRTSKMEQLKKMLETAGEKYSLEASELHQKGRSGALWVEGAVRFSEIHTSLSVWIWLLQRVWIPHAQLSELSCFFVFFSSPGVICGTSWWDINSFWCWEKIGTFKRPSFVILFPLWQIYYFGGCWPLDTLLRVVLYVFHDHEWLLDWQIQRN